MSVILLTWNNWELTMKRLVEFYSYMPWESELVWVDNGTRDETAIQGMQWWIKDSLPKKFKLKFYQFKENQGFGVGNNKGAELATGDALMFISNDVMIKQPFYKPVLQGIVDNPKTIWGGRVIDWEAGWNQFTNDDGREIVVPYCEGYVLAMTKAAWEDIGGFDPIYSPADFEDVDLSLAAIEKGYSLGALDKWMFSHMGGMTANKFLEDRLALTKRNQEKFIQKWRGKIKTL